MSTVAIAGQPFTFPVELYSQADTKLLVTAPTVAAGDFTLTVNGVSFGNLDNTPVVTPAGGTDVEVILSAVETTAAGAGGYLSVTWQDAAGAQWCSGKALVFVHEAEIGTVLVVAAAALTAIAAAVWNALLSGLTAAGSIGKKLADWVIGTLADDAITSAKFDEATAYPLKSADTGTTQVARTGADADTLETLSDQIDGISAAAIADAVWDEGIAGHVAAGSTGEALDNAGGGASPAAIADAVWDEATAGHGTAGTFGKVVGSLSAASVTVISAVDGDTITMIPFTSWEFTIDGLPSLADALPNGVYFSVKRRHSDPDDQALVRVKEGVGLRWIDGHAATASRGSLVVAGTKTSITVHVNASQTGFSGRQSLVWDIKKVITAGEDADEVARGDFIVDPEAVTRTLVV